MVNDPKAYKKPQPGEEKLFPERLEHVEEKFKGDKSDESTDLEAPKKHAGSSELAALNRQSGHKYIFQQSIGFGGMKTVLKVRDKDADRDIAMAIIANQDERPERDVLRFFEESKITASLEHPNIVPVHDIGLDKNGKPYFTMPLLRGESLAQIIEHLREADPDYLESYDLYRLLHIFVKVCNAISYAHSRKILHLDLKPENIQVGDFGEVIVFDWGLARHMDDISDAAEYDNKDIADVKKTVVDRPNITLDGVMKGTPGYMAPEQAAGHNSRRDRRTDIYSLGALLYTILTFEGPQSGKNVTEVIKDTIIGNIEKPRDMQQISSRKIDPALEAVVLKAMNIYPEERYQYVRELRKDIMAFINGDVTDAEDASSLKKTAVFLRQKQFPVFRWILILLILALIILSFTGHLILKF